MRTIHKILIITVIVPIIAVPIGIVGYDLLDHHLEHYACEQIGGQLISEEMGLEYDVCAFIDKKQVVYVPNSEFTGDYFIKR